MNVEVKIDFADIMRASSEIYEKYMSKREANKKDPIANFYLTVDTLREQANTHMNAVKATVSPILEKDDLLTTCNRFRELADDQNFPILYGTAQALIDRTKELDPFNKEPERTNLDRLSTKLAYFQWAVFILQYDSARVVSFSDDAQKLWSELNKNDPFNLFPETQDLQASVQSRLQEAFNWLDLEKRYVFRWGWIPGSDEEVLKEFLQQCFGGKWIDELQFRKEQNNKISGSTKSLFAKNQIEITMDEKSQVVLEVDGNKSTIELEAIQPQWPSSAFSVFRKRPSSEQPTIVPPLKTAKYVADFVKKWFKEWKLHVEHTLIYDRGLFYALGLFEPKRPRANVKPP